MSDLLAKGSDFTRPLEALKECHERTRSQCETLQRLVEHMKGHGCDEQARQTAGNVMHYFETAARRHHEDEEDDLLPRMMTAATTAGGSRLTRLIADIATEHREIEKHWIELRAALQEISAGENIPLDPLNVDRFVKLYASHMMSEEVNVLPLAEMLLSKKDFTEMAASMAQRRAMRTD
jgi:hemerythrin-like domain-containing protein